ncbi:protein phosphatase 1 regulatory subunit 3B [Engraulis encrasicolus]|uniref:protein phosphatase 1 regulatory subunit 3B n=1 Tax=Engraulis encrasicolus TaxID=184585 RepID=UPI002FD4409D
MVVFQGTQGHSQHSNMPVDLAMPLFLSKDLHGKRGSRLAKPLRSCLHPSEGRRRITQVKVTPQQQQQQSKSEEASSLTLNNDNNHNHSGQKKQVSFADHRGLSLTRVKVFSEFQDPIDIPVNIQELLQSSAALSLQEQDAALSLDFAPPSSDYLLLRRRLERDHVCLEHCTLKERSLTGTVKVKNLAFHKSVKVRITFDTWKSYADLECQYVKDTYYADEERDTFSFETCLPAELRPHERVEFAVLYEVDGVQHWDSNGGENYRILSSALKKDLQTTTTSPAKSPASPHGGADDWGIHFDRYGSPRCSHGIFPDWPGYAGYDDIGPYY